MRRQRDLLIWMAIEYDDDPKTGGEVLECEMRATDIQAQRVDGGIHLVVNPYRERTLPLHDKAGVKRHEGDGLLEECSKTRMGFRDQAIRQINDWLGSQAEQGRLHPAGTDLEQSISTFTLYGSDTLPFGEGCMDLGVLMAAIESVNAELSYSITDGIPSEGTRTGTRLDRQIMTYRRIMKVMGETA